LFSVRCDWLELLRSSVWTASIYASVPTLREGICCVLAGGVLIVYFKFTNFVGGLVAPTSTLLVRMLQVVCDLFHHPDPVLPLS
jgi:hypothetical protein